MRIPFASPIRYRLSSFDFELITALEDLKKMYPQTTKSVNYSTSLLLGVTRNRRTWQCSVQILELAVYSCNVRKNRSQIRVRRPRQLLHAATSLFPRTLVRHTRLYASVHSVVRILLSFKARYTSIAPHSAGGSWMWIGTCVHVHLWKSEPVDASTSDVANQYLFVRLREFV